MNEKDKLDDIVDEIENVWGDYDDFKKGGIEYVTFIIESDIQDIRNDNFKQDESIEEFADVIINAIRFIDEIGYDPHEVIKSRLDNHAHKDPESLIQKYESKYENRKTE